MDEARRAHLLDLTTLPSRAWECGWCAQFRGVLRPGEALTAAALRAFADRLAAADAALYARREISPRAYSLLLFHWKCLDALAAAEPFDAETAARPIIYLIEAGLTPEQERGWAEAMVADLHRQAPPAAAPAAEREAFAARLAEAAAYRRPSLAETAQRMLLWLGRRGAWPVLRSIAEFAYHGWRPAHAALLRDSHDYAAWIERLTALVPHLMVRHFIHLYVSEQRAEPRIILGAEGGAFDPGAEFSISPLYARVFSEPEIAALREEEKMVAELFAHAFTTIAQCSEAGVAEHVAALRDMARHKGRIAARQAASGDYRNRLSLPRYAHDAVLRDLAPPAGA